MLIKLAADPHGHFRKQLVADIVPIQVVDAFEIVQVDVE
jgi:hypothetical protein